MGLIMAVSKIKVHRSTVKLTGGRTEDKMKRKSSKLTKLMRGKAGKRMIKYVKF